MQSMGQVGDWGRVGRQRVEAVVQTLATLGCRGESLAEVAHDARNMVTALGLYCDLLEEPGVLAAPFTHYGTELRLVAAASRRLVEKLAYLEARPAPESDAEAQREESAGGADRPSAAAFASGLTSGFASCLEPRFEPGVAGGLDQDLYSNHIGRVDGSPDPESRPDPGLGPDRSLNPALDRNRRWEALFAEPVGNLAAELLANRNLLSALAGPGIAVTVDAVGGARAVRLTSEDLTRLLVNLVKNASEAMPATASGHIQVSLRERAGEGRGAEWLVLAIEDNGTGIAPGTINKIFDSGFTTRGQDPPASGNWPVAHRGLGLAIARSIVEASGGRISASNRPGDSGGSGARIEIELPVRAL